MPISQEKELEESSTMFVQAIMNSLQAADRRLAEVRAHTLGTVKKGWPTKNQFPMCHIGPTKEKLNGRKAY